MYGINYRAVGVAAAASATGEKKQTVPGAVVIIIIISPKVRYAGGLFSSV